VVSTGNLGTTQLETVEYLRANGVQVVGGPTTEAGEHDSYLREVLASEPNLLLDNGGDLFIRYLEAPYDHLLGGTEETTSGRM
jgi:adenosylhomocysteinase